MKKVLIVTPGILPVPASRGGAVEYLTQMYIDKNETDQKFEFDVATTYRLEDKEAWLKYKNTNFIKISEDSKIFKVSRLFRFVLNKLQPFYYCDNAFIHELLKKLKKDKKKYDLIVIENNPLFVKTLRKYDKNVKIILHLHNDYLNSRTKHSKFILDNCYRVYTVSDYIGERVRSISDSSKISTIYNGIDIDRFSEELSNNKKNKIRAQFGLRSDDFVILFAGRLVQEKGILELLIAFRDIAKQHNNARLLIVGKGFVERSVRSRFERKLQRIARSLNNKVVFTGFVDYENMPNIYAISDVSVTPSHWGEPLATTVLEGMASGIPQIVTNDGGIPEEVFGSNAYVINKDNLIIELSSMIDELISRPVGCSEINKTIAKDRFDKERYIAAMMCSIGGGF